MGTITCLNNATSYSTLAAFEAAINGVDFGSKAIGEVSGTVTDVGITKFLGPYPHGVEIRAASGEEFTGVEGVGAVLKNNVTVFSNDGTVVTPWAVEVYDLQIANDGGYTASLINLSSYSKFDFKIERCGIFNRGFTNSARIGISATQSVNALAPQTLTMRDCVVVANAIALKIIGDRSLNGAMLVERVTAEGINAATAVTQLHEKQVGALVVRDVLSIGAGTPDFNFLATPVNTDFIASGDTSSNVVTNYETGITTSVFEDYATGDYRIKSDATGLIGTGSSGGNIGAFVQGSSSDTTPDAFSFTDQTDVALSALTTSNTLTITGMDAGTAISVSGGEMSINSGAFTSTSTTIDPSDTVQLRVTSSASNSTATNVTLTIGTESDIWTVTTVAGASVGTITTGPFKNNTGTLQTGLTDLRVVVLDPTDGTTVLNSTGNTTHATTAVLTLSDAALTASETYAVITLNTAGTAIGAELITAT